MLLPFQWAVLTVEEARLLMSYIESSTATKSQFKNYDKMQKAGMLQVYEKLREFVETSVQWEGNLRWLDPNNFETRED